MPYTKSNVKDKIPGTKSLTDKQLGVFIAVANEEIGKGTKEDKAIKMAYGAAKKLKKSLLLKALEQIVDMAVGELEDDNVIRKKALDEEQRIELSVVYMPNTKDAHDEWMSKETVANMSQALHKGFIEDKNLDLNLWHTDLKIPREEAEVLDVSLTKSDMWVGDKFIPEGTCTMEVKYHNRKLWKMRKAGVIGGFSVHGKKGKKQ